MKVTSSFPHLVPLLCGVDVSYETPPFIPVLRIGPIHVNLNKTVFYVSQVNIFCLLSCTRMFMAY